MLKLAWIPNTMDAYVVRIFKERPVCFFSLHARCEGRSPTPRGVTNSRMGRLLSTASVETIITYHLLFSCRIAHSSEYSNVRGVRKPNHQPAERRTRPRKNAVNAVLWRMGDMIPQRKSAPAEEHLFGSSQFQRRKCRDIMYADPR
jgi:hypothetical protein